MLAPTSATELFEWIDREIQAWSWLSSVGGGSYRGAIDNNIGPVRNAHGHAQQAMQYEANTPGAGAQFYGQIQAAIQDTFIARAFPHSNSPLFHAVEQIRGRDPMEAVAYLYTRMHGANNYQFDARDISSWRGFLAGVLEQIPTDGIPARAYQSALDSMSDTRANTERLLAEKTEAYSALHRNYERVSADVSTIKANQEALFEGFMETNQKAQDDALAAHQGRMKTLEDTFREKMALRAPVEYWEGRQKKHEKGTKVMGGLSFGAMALLAITIGRVASWVLQNLTPDGKPEVWRVSVLVLIGVLGVWATRLLVRMFLSNIHLATDAAERVVMVKTYLSLLEDDKVLSDEDRKLVLQSLFRPASDGIVKDEGLPHPALDILTKLGGR